MTVRSRPRRSLADLMIVAGTILLMLAAIVFVLDEPAAAQQNDGTITLLKNVVNDDGGTLTPDDFDLFIEGVPAQSGVAYTLPPGVYHASETLVPGYAPSDWFGDCAPCGEIVLAPGDDFVCEIINDDEPATLTLIKTVVNDDGGTAVVGDFSLFIDGVAADSGVAYVVPAGAHTASETPVPGYVPSGWSGDCDAAGDVVLAPGQDGVCEITNDDLPPASLTLIKIVVNDDGGTLTPADFDLFIDGVPADSGVVYDVAPGDYVASETPIPGYTPGDWGGDCDAAGNVTVGAGEHKICEISNDDEPPTLTVIKDVVNDDAGTLAPDDFDLFIDGTPALSGVPYPVAPGAHAVTETEQAGYTLTGFGGDCDADGNVTVALGEDKICIVTNDDDPGTTTTSAAPPEEPSTTTEPPTTTEATTTTLAEPPPELPYTGGGLSLLVMALAGIGLGLTGGGLALNGLLRRRRA